MESYGKVHRLGKTEVAGILDDEVYVEEKVDGSQFAFGVNGDGVLWAASRGGLINLDAPASLFGPSVAAVKKMHADGALQAGLTYRGEAVCAPRHNKLTYGRAPKGNIALFDVQAACGAYLPRAIVKGWAEALGLECVPMLAPPGRYGRDDIDRLVDGESFLGGPREGVVVKRNGGGADRMKAKVVGRAFSEKTGAKPSKGSDLQQIVEMYRTEAHWDKCIQHLAEAGRLTGEPKDIGPLMGEHARDLKEECESEIREVLWPKIWKQIVKGCSNGLPEHYLKRIGTK